MTKLAKFGRRAMKQQDKKSEHRTQSHTDVHGHNSHHIQELWKRFIVSLILTIPIVALSPMVWEWFGFTLDIPYRKVVIFALAATLYFYGGAPFLRGSIKELRHKNPGMMTLIAMAISVAFFYSTYSLFVESAKEFFWELATLIDVMLLGHYIEAKSVMGAANALEGIVQLIPKKAHKIVHEGVIDVTIQELLPKDIIIVKPGERIPCDGIVVDGESLVDESFLSGESRLIRKERDTKVYMGSANVDGMLKVEVAKEGKDSYLSQVIALVKEAQESRSKTQDLANRASKWLFFAALGASATTFLYWVQFLEVSQALLMSVTVLIIACPHALGLAVPLVVAISTTKAAKNGILIRNKEAFENLRNVDAICFDKTGTLTQGRLFVEKVVGDVLGVAAAIEKFSEHTIAKAIVEEAERNLKTIPNAQNFKIFPGVGAQGEVEGKRVYIGNEKILQKLGITLPKIFEKYKQASNTKVWVVVDGVVEGVILLSDRIRTEAKEAVARLRKLGIQTMMLTGDGQEVAKKVANVLGIDRYYAELLPDEKVRIVQELQKEGKKVAMVGDGVNDAPALLSADIGVAIGAGTDIAAQSADIILTKSSVMDVAKAIHLSRATYKKMVQNLWWASGYNILAIPLAGGILYRQGILIEPAVGAVLMSLSTVVVAVNARLLKNVEM